MNLGNRIQLLRKEKGVTQATLSKEIGVSLPQIVRYETKEVQPPADVLKKMGAYFGTSIDFIVNGTIEEKAQNALSDNDLLSQFRELEKMDEGDKSVVKQLIEAFLAKRKIQKIVA